MTHLDQKTYLNRMNEQLGNQFIGPTVKKADVIARSIALSKALEIENGMGMQNMPTDPEKRVEIDAAIRMAKDATRKARQLYDNAFEAWARGGYQE